MTKGPVATPARFGHSFLLQRMSSFRPVRAFVRRATNGCFADRAEILRATDLRVLKRRSGVATGRYEWLVCTPHLYMIMSFIIFRRTSDARFGNHLSQP